MEETFLQHVYNTSDLIGAHQLDDVCCCSWQTATCDLPSKKV